MKSILDGSTDTDDIENNFILITEDENGKT